MFCRYCGIFLELIEREQLGSLCVDCWEEMVADELTAEIEHGTKQDDTQADGPLWTIPSTRRILDC